MVVPCRSFFVVVSIDSFLMVICFDLFVTYSKDDKLGFPVVEFDESFSCMVVVVVGVCQNFLPFLGSIKFDCLFLLCFSSSAISFPSKIS